MPVPDSTRSWSTFNDIHHWLRKCDQNHVKCIERRKGQSQKVPARLLDVTAFEPGPRVYLRERSEIPIGSKYVTLSHCWGLMQHPLKLQTTNYDQFRSGIRIDELPQTFRDAIGLTRALGLNFLWIDSL